MTDHEAAALVARVSEEVADAFRPRLREVERESDRILGEMRTLRRRLAAKEGVEEQLRAALEERDQRIATLTAQLQQAVEVEARGRPGRPAAEAPDQIALELPGSAA